MAPKGDPLDRLAEVERRLRELEKEQDRRLRVEVWSKWPAEGVTHESIACGEFGKVEIRNQVAEDDEAGSGGSVIVLAKNIYPFAMPANSRCTVEQIDGLLLLRPREADPTRALEDCKHQLPNRYAWNVAQYTDQVLLLDDGRCWYVRECLTAEETGNRVGQEAEKVVILAGPFTDCESCTNCYKLTECNPADPENPEIIYTNTDLSQHIGKVVKPISGTKCYTVEAAYNCESPEPIGRYDYYETCTPCDYCYTLENCYDSEETIVIRNDLARIATEQIQEDDEDAEALTGDDLVSMSAVFEINKKCYKVTAWENDCAGEEAEPVEVGRYFPSGCYTCGCVKLTECLPEDSEDEPEIIFAHAASVGAESVSLREIMEGDPDADPPVPPQSVARLDSGKCYSMSTASAVECEEEDTVEVSVLEFYENCGQCKVYTLAPCAGGGDITTYTDLAGLGLVRISEDTGLPISGDVIQRDDDTCWTVTNATADFAGAVDFTPKPGEGNFPNCGTCLSEVKYRLENTDCVHPDCGDDAEPAPEIITTEDLHDAVGQWVKVQGVSYVVSVAEDDPAVTDPTLEYTGPYASCEEAQAAASTWKQEVVEHTEWDGEDLIEHYSTITVTGRSRCPKTRNVDETVECEEE